MQPTSAADMCGAAALLFVTWWLHALLLTVPALLRYRYGHGTWWLAGYEAGDSTSGV